MTESKYSIKLKKLLQLKLTIQKKELEIKDLQKLRQETITKIRSNAQEISILREKLMEEI